MDTNDTSIVVEESGPAPSPPPAVPAPAEPSAETPPEAPVEPVESAPTRTDEPSDDDPDPVQRRINRAIFKQREAEREAAYLRGRLEAAEQQRQQAPAPPLPPSEPQEGDFENYAAYVAALHRFHAKQALDAERAAQAQQAAQEAQQRLVAEQHAAIQAREAELLKEHPDYYEQCRAVVQQIAPHVKWGIEMTGAHGPDLVLYLASHPDAVAKLNQTLPHALGIELGLLRAGASANGTAAARSATPPGTKPEPPTPISGGGRTTTPGYREDMTQEEYEAWWTRVSKRR